MFPRLDWLLNLGVWVAGVYAIWVAVCAVLLFV